MSLCQDFVLLLYMITHPCIEVWRLCIRLQILAIARLQSVHWLSYEDWMKLHFEALHRYVKVAHSKSFVHVVNLIYPMAEFKKKFRSNF